MKTPTAFRHSALGCRVREATLGNGAMEPKTLKGLRRFWRTNRCNPVGVENILFTPTPGSRCAPTLGCMTLPRWGKQLATAQSEKDHTDFENKCTSLTRQGDALVYDRYGLNDAEIKIIEGAA